jgi:hypothetical protein
MAQALRHFFQKSSASVGFAPPSLVEMYSPRQAERVPLALDKVRRRQPCGAGRSKRRHIRTIAQRFRILVAFENTTQCY